MNVGLCRNCGRVWFMDVDETCPDCGSTDIEVSDEEVSEVRINEGCVYERQKNQR